jgi:ribose 5-phosphate isomerase B
MKIAIGADHAAYELKEQLKPYLTSLGYQIEDVGTFSNESTDYPTYAANVARLIQEKKTKEGILICGTGIGMSIAANKFRGIRAAAVSEVFSAQAAKEHNNANVLCFGARVVDYKTAVELIDAWRNATYQGARHDQRLALIEEIETKEQR